MRPETERSYRERMLRVLVYIQQHLDETLALENLAAIAHFSAYHFHRVFLGMVGESLMAHVRRLRLERAAMRLKHTDRPVTQIAFEAGYETHEAFTRAFHVLFGEPPTRFREIHKPLALPDAPSGVHYHPAGSVNDFTPHSTGGAPMEASIKKMGAMRVAFIRHAGPYNEVGPTWGKLCAWAGRHGLFGPQTVMFGLCHDDPQVTPPDRIRYDACIVAGDQVQAEGEVGIQTIPAGEYAVTIHRGPYSGLAQTYARLCGEWIPQHGRELRNAPAVEIYRNNPSDTPPEQLVTEVCVPVE